MCSCQRLRLVEATRAGATVANATALIMFKKRLDFVAAYNYNYDQGIEINRGIET
jgi:hypothetical protein